MIDEKLATQNYVQDALSNFHLLTPNIMIVPDYANQETIPRITASGDSWTADRSGFMNCYVWTYNASTNGHIHIEIFIDDVSVASADNSIGNGDHWWLLRRILPISKGQKIRCNLVTYNGATISGRDFRFFFIPPKFIKEAAPIVEIGSDYSLTEQPVLINDGGTVRQKLYFDNTHIYRKSFQVSAPIMNAGTPTVIGNWETLISTNLKQILSFTCTESRNDNNSMSETVLGVLRAKKNKDLVFVPFSNWDNTVFILEFTVEYTKV
jgi:hypothetical protein